MPLGGGGYLVLKRPWPAMLRGIYGDPERYKRDVLEPLPGHVLRRRRRQARRGGLLWLLGRVDDVMNVSGHRLSTTEIESALVSHPAVAEAAVVGGPDPVTGEAIFAFVILAARLRADRGARRRAARARRHDDQPDRQAQGPDVHAGPAQDPLAARSCAACSATSPQGRALGDTTTLADAGVVETIRENSWKAED